MSEDIQDCERHVARLRDGTQFYFMMGKNFITCTVPFENRPENEKTREIMDAFCDAVTQALGGSNG